MVVRFRAIVDLVYSIYQLSPKLASLDLSNHLTH